MVELMTKTKALSGDSPNNYLDFPFKLKQAHLFRIGRPSGIFGR
jgi:hypothetical protein